MENSKAIIFSIILVFVLSSKLLYSLEGGMIINHINLEVYGLQNPTAVTMSDDQYNFTLTWTSYDNTQPQFLEDGAIAIGDHVTLTARFEVSFEGQSITYCIMMLIGDQDLNVTRCKNASSISFDTYELCKNMTVNATFIGVTKTGDAIRYDFSNITFCNFFTPKVRVLEPNGLEDWSTGIHNITWYAEDRNANDSLHFMVEYSNDYGSYWQLITKYFAGNKYSEDMPGYYFLEFAFGGLLSTDEALIRVTVHDNDTSIPNRIHPLFQNESLPINWPDLKRSDKSDTVYTAGSAHSRIIPWLPPPSISGSADITYTEGETGNVIYWQINGWFSDNTKFEITRNGTQWTQYSCVGQSFAAFVDGLEVGVHVFVLHIYEDGKEKLANKVIVTVLPEKQNTGTTVPMSKEWLFYIEQIIDGFLDGITAGSLFVFIVFSFLIIKAKVRREGVWAES